MDEPRKASVEDLLRQFRAGDLQARDLLFALLGSETKKRSSLNAIARRLLPRHHVARRVLDTQDIVQSAQRTAWSNLAGFRGGTERELYGWLRAILRTKVSRAFFPRRNS